MIEGCTQPVGRRVALLTSFRELRQRMIRVGRPAVVRLMALDTSPIGNRVCPALEQGRVVALRALQRCMRPGKREAGGRVVECAARPVRRVVALLAGLRETGQHVIRISGAGEIGLVTLDASIVETIRPVRKAGSVTLRALQRGVRSGQSKAGCGVVESCPVPIGRRVALLTSCRELCLRMIRVGRPPVVRLMALHTSPIGNRVCPA